MKSKMTVDAHGDKRWYNEAGQLHRIGGPAIEWADGNKTWWVNGQLHRIDGPAVEWANGEKEWWVNGQLHREDGPAVEHVDGYKSWWVRDKLVYELEADQPYSPAINRLICALFCKIS